MIVIEMIMIYDDLLGFDPQIQCNGLHFQPKLHANDVAECRCFTRRDRSSTLVALESKTLHTCSWESWLPTEQLECKLRNPFGVIMCNRQLSAWSFQRIPTRPETEAGSSRIEHQPWTRESWRKLCQFCS